MSCFCNSHATMCRVHVGAYPLRAAQRANRHQPLPTTPSSPPPVPPLPLPLLCYCTCLRLHFLINHECNPLPPPSGAPGGLALLASEPWLFLAAPAVSAAVNGSCFAAIAATSSLTFKVAGCIKNVAVVV